MSKYFYDSPPMLINPDIALALGLNEAVVIQQMQYWLSINEEAGRNYYEGRYWTYNSLKDWHENYFSFWSFSTVRRTIHRLETLGVFITGTFNFSSSDRTKWYAIDHDVLDKLIREHKEENKEKEKNESKEKPYPQNGEMVKSPNWADAYVHNEHIYKQAEINYTETNSIYPSEKFSSREEARSYVEGLIGYDGLINISSEVSPWLDNLVDLVAEVFMHEEGRIKIAGRDMKISLVQEQFKRLNQDHLIYLVESLERTKPDVKNIKSYLLTSLYNAPNTASSFYKAKNNQEEMKKEKEELKKYRDEKNRKYRGLGIKL
ncbi:MAG: hypothetical protein GX666_03500 [Tissierellia bacterium]|nr:hypothetical protein [Tissierellia bacterium]